MIYKKEYETIINEGKNYGNYINILNFSKEWRYSIYKKNKIHFKGTEKIVILEGCANNGDYYGFLFIDDDSYYYKYLFSEHNKWLFKKVDLGELSENIPGVNFSVLNIVREWEIEKILTKKSQIGYSILGGHSFIITKVQLDKSNNPKIDTYIFEEFVE